VTFWVAGFLRDAVPRSDGAALLVKRSIILLAFFYIGMATFPATGEVLTNASQVLSLSADRAKKRIPIHVTGVVTMAATPWQGKFFVQDSTGGVFVNCISDHHPAPGDWVDVVGISQPGAYAPVISEPSWKKLGTAPMPDARPVPIEQLMSGSEDGQRVEIAGVVRGVAIADASAKLDQGLLDVAIVSGGYRVEIYMEVPGDADPKTFIGARVRVRGTAAASFNATLRRLITTKIFVPLRSDFVVEQREGISPFDEPIVPLDSIAQYQRDIPPGKRIHVKGVVALQRPGESVFIEDGICGLYIRTHEQESFPIGSVVEAAGFQGFDHFLPLLEDAAVRKIANSSGPVLPKIVAVGEIQSGFHHADLVQLKGTLLNRVVTPSSSRAGARWSTVLTLQSDDLIFSAVAETSDATTELASVPVGSTVELTGICFIENGDDQKFKSLQILLADARSLRLLQAPSWWTPPRLLGGLVSVVVVLVMAVRRIVMVSKRNFVLNELVREKEKAQRELQQAHGELKQANDQLEEKVRERTAQLKFQITERKESELQYKGAIAERTRLAQEVHDTLEQTLTGIALQLDTTAKLFAAKPAGANHHLELARDLVAQSQAEVRSSVWNLRSRALEQFDLPGALATTGKQLTDGTNVHFEVSTTGPVRPLPEIIEENLLRIAQEALTNAIKHSQATLVEVELDYGPKTVVLQVTDNGRGFLPDQCSGPGEGHFGLLGISERARRLGTEMILQTGHGAGTTVRVQVMLDQEFQAEPISH
jgi:signal transduction histidine kinase